MYGDIHLSENETYKPGENCISCICAYVSIYKNRTTIKASSFRQQQDKNVYNLTLKKKNKLPDVFIYKQNAKICPLNQVLRTYSFTREP